MYKLVCTFIFLPLFIFSQDDPSLAVSLIPAELMENANAVIREEVIDFEVASPGRATKKVKRVVTIFNKNTDYNYMVVHYSSFNKLGKIKGRVYDAQGNLIRSLKKNETRDVSAISGFSIYEDSRVKYLEVIESNYPYTVEFEYSIVYKDIMGYPGWDLSEYKVGAEYAEVNISVPKGFDIFYEALNLEVEPVVSQNDEKEKYTWPIKNIPPLEKEKYGLSPFEISPSLKISPSKFEIEGYEGSMASWKDFGLFFKNLSEGRDELSPEMKKTVQQLTSGINSDKEKINRLYKYMQENMRYVSVQLGIGGWQPFSAKYVETNKYGDCKALSNFMYSMLKEAGIKSYPTLIYAGDLNYDIHEDFTCNAFNHAILHVPEEDYWLECTSSTAPPNYLGSGTEDRNVLLITEEGGVVARTPKLGTENNVEKNQLKLALQNTGAAQLEMNAQWSGDRQEYFRYASKNLSKDELQKVFQKSISLPSFTLENLTVTPNPDLPQAEVHCEASVPRFASKAGKRLFVPLNPMNAFSDVPEALGEEREQPIVRKEGYTEMDEIVFSIPAGYSVESIPGEAVKIESEHVRYFCQVKAGEGTVTVERKLEVFPCRLPAESYEEWREVYKQISKADGAKMVLVGQARP